MTQPQAQQGNHVDNQRVSLVDAKAQLYLELQNTSKAKYTEADIEVREALIKDPDMQKRLKQEQ